MEIDINGIIGFDVTASDFINSVNEASKDEPIRIMVNSFGGSFLDGFGIYKHLKSIPNKVIVRVNAYALSAAMLPVLASDEIIADDDSIFMIHRVWSIMMGNSKELKEESEILNVFDNTLFKILAQETGRCDLEKVVDQAPNGELWLQGVEELMSKLFKKPEDDVPEAAQSPTEVSPGDDLEKAVNQALNAERERTISILAIAGAPKDALNAIREGKPASEFACNFVKPVYNSSYKPPAPMGKVEEAGFDFAKKLAQETAERYKGKLNA